MIHLVILIRRCGVRSLYIDMIEVQYHSPILVPSHRFFVVFILASHSSYITEYFLIHISCNAVDVVFVIGMKRRQNIDSYVHLVCRFIISHNSNERLHWKFSIFVYVKRWTFIYTHHFTAGLFVRSFKSAVILLVC